MKNSQSPTRRHTDSDGSLHRIDIKYLTHFPLPNISTTHLLNSMNQSTYLLLHLLLLPPLFAEEQGKEKENLTSQDIVTSFRPSLAVVLAILLVMFFFTFLLVLYAKFCHREDSVHTDRLLSEGLNRSASHLSGIDKRVIESLPLFRFSTLKGSKEGLECAICLGKFEDIEILRFLPKCKHAFHINCIDRWLDCHSSCPICRRKVHPEDLAGPESSFRLLSGAGDPSNLEVFVQREEECFGCEEEEEEVFSRKRLHKVNHQIFISDVVFKNRWSNVSSSDLLFLDSEMLRSASDRRFEGTSMADDKRSQSEITGLSRFRELRKLEVVSSMDNNEGGRRIAWLHIARRTAQWFASRERKIEVRGNVGFLNV